MTTNDIKIFFFGDSICFGQGVSIHKGWVSRIAHELDKLTTVSSPYTFLLSNASINGNTTRLALERMPYDIQSHHPDILLVQFGMNDCNFWDSDNGCPRVSIDSFKSNMKEIVTRAFLNGTKIAILNTNHPTLRNKIKLKNSELTYQDSNKQYNQAIREIFWELKAIHKEKIHLNDIEENFNLQSTPLSDLILSDHLHLSERGHAIYFDVVFPTVKSSIEYLCKK